MQFRDGNNHELVVTLTPLYLQSPQHCFCKLEVAVQGKITETYEGLEPIYNLENLATWVDEIWNEVPDISLTSIPLTLSYGHREHIGEVFYSVIVNGTKRIYVYEQTNSSNTARAQALRSEIAALHTT